MVIASSVGSFDNTSTTERVRHFEETEARSVLDFGAALIYLTTTSAT
jgi:hypothetical protein